MPRKVFYTSKIMHLCKECLNAHLRSCHHCDGVGHHHHSICPKKIELSVLV